ALFWINGAYSASSNAASPFPFPFWMVGIPFVLVGASMVLSPIWYFWRAGRTTYILTDQRAIIDVSGPFPHRTSVPLSQVPFIETRQSFGGFGDVLFQEPIRTAYNRGMMQRDGFVAIAEPDRVEQLLRSAMEKSRSRLPDLRQ